MDTYKEKKEKTMTKKKMKPSEIFEPETTPGTLQIGEYHPAADIAMNYLRSLSFQECMIWSESFASTALSGNRSSEICHETMKRILDGQPVSDRYLMGLYIIMTQKKEGI
jgi:hypothetical protein